MQKLPSKEGRSRDAWRAGTDNAICGRLTHMAVMGYKIRMMMNIYEV